MVCPWCPRFVLRGGFIAVILPFLGLSPAAQAAMAPSISRTLAVDRAQRDTVPGTYRVVVGRTLTSSSMSVPAKPVIVSIASAALATTIASGSTALPLSAASELTKFSASAVPAAAAPTLSSIAVSPSSVSLGLNAQQQYTAVGSYSDGSTRDITQSVTWTSGNPSIVEISATGLAQVLSTSSNAVSIIATSGSVTSNWAWLSALSSLPPVCQSPTIDMKLLVVTTGRAEADFPAITQILDYVGVPYTVFDMAAQPGGLTAATLSDGRCHGFYQGVIFSTGGYIYSLSGMGYLNAYEQTFGVRQLNWYTYPGTDFGFQAPTGSISPQSPYQGAYTADGQALFPYLNGSTALNLSSATIYLAKPNTPPSGTTITPLVVDSSGNALSLTYKFADGREYLTQTFDSNQYLTHDLVLAYGLLNWVTRGVYLGEYHVYAAAQVDDFFINDSEWIPGTPCTNAVTHDRTPPDASFLPTFRLKAADMTSLVAWQNKIESDPLLSTFKLSLAFNGVGTTGNKDWTGLPTAGVEYDDLTYTLRSYEASFHWMTHTYDHPGTLNGLHKSDEGGDPGTPKVDSIDLEILTNNYVANGSGRNLDTDSSDNVAIIGLTDFNPASAVTPGVTGLNDVNVPTYLHQDGIQYVVSDTSVANIVTPPNNDGNNPSPNVGIVNSYEPGIYEVPRHPNNIFYNAASWSDDQSEFSCIYNNPVQPPYSTFNADQILDYVSSSFVANMLMGDMDPQMFHQPNLHDYDGLGHSLISDTYDQMFSKYEALYRLPVLSLTLDQLGLKMKERASYNASGVTGRIVGAGGSRQIVLAVPTSSTSGSIYVPVTGLSASGSETYGAVTISHVPVSPGQTVTLPFK